MTAPFFRYSEPRYYKFGLRLGLANLFRNGFHLGIKKTVGLVAQPINSHWRFAEYYLLGRSISCFLTRQDPARRVRVLDVGSPKCFGLYLAYHFAIEAHLTDIDEPTVLEAKHLWRGVRSKKRGAANFSIQDTRSLGYPDRSFDVVYSMSVVEHIAGNEGDSMAIREMARVLKPGGILAVSVPFGQTYIEQEIMGFCGAAQKTKDRERYFFQRIYSPAMVEQRILQAAPGLCLQTLTSIGRRKQLFWHLHGRLGPVPGLLGFLYPLLSTINNSSQDGLVPPPGRYGPLNTARDIYGDAVLVWQKAERPASKSVDGTDT